MNQLRCGVQSCAANREGCCCRPEIHVEGPRARASRETCCSSFQEELRGVTNNAVSQTPNPRCEVLCDAHKCLHNCNGCCCAPEVDIAGDGAQSSGETSCRSFRSK